MLIMRMSKKAIIGLIKNEYLPVFLYNTYLFKYFLNSLCSILVN